MMEADFVNYGEEEQMGRREFDNNASRTQINSPPLVPGHPLTPEIE